MQFQHSMNDKIKVIKSTGQEIENLRANITNNVVLLMQSNILIESNDFIQRIMSNGGIETFKVIDSGFHESSHSIPAHYQMKVQKLGIPEAEKAIHTITYNISGSNARINHNSIDNSTNILNINQDISEHLLALRQEIEKIVKTSEEKKDAFDVVDVIQGQFESGNPSKAVIKTLISSLPHVGNIASIGSFLLSLIGG